MDEGNLETWHGCDEKSVMTAVEIIGLSSARANLI